MATIAGVEWGMTMDSTRDAGLFGDDELLGAWEPDEREMGCLLEFLGPDWSSEGGISSETELLIDASPIASESATPRPSPGPLLHSLPAVKCTRGPPTSGSGEISMRASHARSGSFSHLQRVSLSLPLSLQRVS